MEQFSANGKLLLSGEYAVLYGARSLAIPCSFGQHLQVRKTGESGIEWKSYDYQDNIWFYVSLTNNLDIIDCNDLQKARYLQKLLKKAKELSGLEMVNFTAETKLDFPNSWGLGSSSTLIFLIASFYRVDPMELFMTTTKGSGYDVACAGEREPIVFQRSDHKFYWETVKLPEVFKYCFFIHLNKKQSSINAIEAFEKKEFDRNTLVNKINLLTDKFLEARNKRDLQSLMQDHEKILSDVLGILPVKDQLFSDFNGSIKSLGAWGGDFIMALGEDVESYFQQKGYTEIYSFDKMKSI